MNKNIEFFFCYTKRLSDYIWKKAGIKAVTVAINPRTGKKFSLYIKDEKLKKLIDEYEKVENKDI